MILGYLKSQKLAFIKKQEPLRIQGIKEFRSYTQNQICNGTLNQGR